MNPISLRINELVEKYFDNNNSKFAEKASLSEANIRNYRKGTLPKLDFLVNIYENANVNFEWLLIGNGEPILSKGVETVLNEPETSHTSDKEEVLQLLRERIVLLENNRDLYKEQCETLKKLLEDCRAEKISKTTVE